MEKPIYCRVCHNSYDTHEANSRECYETRIKRLEELVAIYGQTPVVCENCQAKTQARFLMNTVKGSGCVSCVDYDYICNNAEYKMEARRIAEQIEGGGEAGS
jgi:hypothetical protein